MSSFLFRLLEALLGLLGIKIIPAPKIPARAFLSFTLPLPKGAHLRGRIMQLPIGDKTTAHLIVDDAAGDVLTSPVVPAPVWTSSDASIATVTPAADGMSADITGLKTGDVTVNVVVTTNSDGSPKVTATGSVSVVAGDPASASLTFDPPVPVAPPAPAPAQKGK